MSILFQNVSFSHDRATQTLIRDLSVNFPQGWTGVVGANGVGKSTVLKLATGDLKPQHGRVVNPDFGVYCPQRTDKVPNGLSELIHARISDAFQIKGRLGVEDDWLNRWSTLSHGERKRAQIAVALWRNPQVLAVDEPTNHLDIQARDLLFAALSKFNGVGLLVSHDRKFLDDLCHQCLFVDPPDAILRRGNYTQGLKQAQDDYLTVQKQRDRAKHEFARLRCTASKRRGAASQANRRRSKRGLATKDHDSKGKIDMARVSGKDGSAGKQLNQLKGRLSQAKAKIDQFKVKKSYALGIWMTGAHSKRNTLYNIPAGSLPLGEMRSLHYPRLSMRPDDRIALTGVNGSGKSTLIQHILEFLDLPEDKLTYLPQEIDINASKDIMAQARGLPHDQLGKMMTVVSCLDPLSKTSTQKRV